MVMGSGLATARLGVSAWDYGVNIRKDVFYTNNLPGFEGKTGKSNKEKPTEEF